MNKKQLLSNCRDCYSGPMAEEFTLSKQMTNVQMSINVQRADRVSRQSFSSLNQPISGGLFLWKSQEWMPWLPLLKWEDWVNSRVVLRPSPHSSCAESRPRCGLSRCFLPSPRASTEGGGVHRKLHEEQVPTLSSACCAAGSITFRAGGAQRGGNHWWGLAELWRAEASSAPSHFWGRNRRTSVWLLKPAKPAQDDSLTAQTLTEGASQSAKAETRVRRCGSNKEVKFSFSRKTKQKQNSEVMTVHTD